MIEASSRVAQVLRPLAANLAGLMLAAGVVVACPICFSGRLPQTGQKIDAADIVALAAPLGENGSYRIVQSVKGELAPGVLVADASSPSPELQTSGALTLIVRNRSSQRWAALGSAGEAEVAWLQAFAGGGPEGSRSTSAPWPRGPNAAGDLKDEEWIARLRLVAPALESANRLIAEIAYSELARAPYRLMRHLRGARSPAEVQTWLVSETLAARRPGYLLLLGIVGGDNEAASIEAQIAQRHAAGDADNLSALITAALELRGPSQLRFVIDAYLSDKAREVSEIEAALLALSVQGTADAAIPRAEVVSAYGAFVRARPAMAGFVVQDLMEWRAFELIPDFQAALASGAMRDKASQAMVLSYLRRDTARPSLARQGSMGDLPP